MKTDRAGTSETKYGYSHSMAMGNLNKSKETTKTTTTALKVAPYKIYFIGNSF